MNGKFIINNIICFDADNFTVSRINNKECRCLAGVKGRCLLLLLEAKDHEVTTKKQLHFAVWEKFGFYSNDNCLLQTIYSLRKELKQLGLEDIILTSPRVGYKINPRYDINNISGGDSPGENFTKEEDCLFSQRDIPPQLPELSIEKKIRLYDVHAPLIRKTVIASLFIFFLFLLPYFNIERHDIYFLGSQKRLVQLINSQATDGVITDDYLQSCKQSDLQSESDANIYICNSSYKNIKNTQ